jgi:hypothetical protein
MNNKPEPIIEEIKFTPEQLQDIKEIIEGKPSLELKQRWLKNGITPKYFLPPSLRHRIEKIRKTYYKGLGLCHRCHELPEYKILYKYDGITVQEFFCKKHLPNNIILNSGALDKKIH